ncbi:MAG TPA: hypothetical protein VEK11_08525 [Thermoanaerobaculia bacterium]|nr:hypothetical protein [Thermoanaerobaculia bacterium]
MRRTLLVLALLLPLVSCSSGGTAPGVARPAEIAQPAIHIAPVHDIFFGRGSSAAVALEIEVTNRANVPLLLREVEVSSSGMMQYTLRTRRQRYNETLAPGETKRVTLFTEAYANVRNPSEPLSMRSFVFFEVNGKLFREIVFSRG